MLCQELFQSRLWEQILTSDSAQDSVESRLSPELKAFGFILGDLDECDDLPDLRDLRHLVKVVFEVFDLLSDFFTLTSESSEALINGLKVIRSTIYLCLLSPILFVKSALAKGSS